MITDVDTNPRITALIDWELSGSEVSASFAQYPLFIVDHPAWDEDHPLRKRNIQDQATFDELMCAAEHNHSAISGMPLSHLISKSYSIYLFEQTMYCPILYSVFYPLIFSHVFGNEDIQADYYWALEKGILKKDMERFDKEHEVWLEAREVLGEDVVGRDLKVAEFKHLISNHLERFGSEGKVLKWLATVN